MMAMAGLGRLWNSIQTWLFPMLEDELGKLDDKHREFVAVCETCARQTHTDRIHPCPLACTVSSNSP